MRQPSTTMVATDRRLDVRFMGGAQRAMKATGRRTQMSDTARYVRPPSDASRGDAPGRDRLRGRRILVVGGGQRSFDAATDPIDLATVVGESQFHVNAFVGDPHVRFDDPAQISVRVIMEKTR